MGSNPLFFLADVFMNHIEYKLILNNTFSKKIIFCHRYVDDILMLFGGSLIQFNSFFSYINNLRSRIKYMVEFENNNTIPFLDLLPKI